MERIKKLLTVNFDDMTKEDKQFLESYGVINGVGPESYGRVLRAIMTSLFSFLDYERHDVAFRQGGTIEDFHKANWGILKYSFISLANEYKEICKQGLKKLILVPKFYILLLPKVLIILLGYNACEKKGMKAFNFN